METFDGVAGQYDKEFTQGVTGRKQRQQVWDYLQKQDWFTTPRNILDIHCGTGEDAMWLATHQHKVVATDVSAAMLQEAKSKDTSLLTRFLKLDLRDSDWGFPEGSFDVVLSNFSGLNCFSPEEMKDIGMRIDKVLVPGGHFIAVVFGRHCVTEMLYFLSKGNISGMRRRLSKNAVEAKAGDQSLNIWYHSVRDFQAFLPGFRLRKKFAIGLFHPPSYLEERFNKHPTLVKTASRLEKFASGSTWLHDCGDHLLLDFEKK